MVRWLDHPLQTIWGGPSDSQTVATTDTAPVLPTDGSANDVMDEPPSGSISPTAPPGSDEVPMDQPSPFAASGSLPPRVDLRPTMDDPLSSDIEWIERQYAAGGNCSFIDSRINQARPYTLPHDKYDMMIATSRTLAKTPLQKILVSLSGKHYGNDSLNDPNHSHKIGQISKLLGGDLRIRVKLDEARIRLERTKVSILGGAYTVKELDVLGGSTSSTSPTWARTWTPT
uniref:Uncharacterized protein n=1 Tax=Peronospora matthiolae TaxID=2874970 RepID=A0AAV1TA82_9STRA